MCFIAASATFHEKVPVRRLFRIDKTSCFFLMTGFYLCSPSFPESVFWSIFISLLPYSSTFYTWIGWPFYILIWVFFPVILEAPILQTVTRLFGYWMTGTTVDFLHSNLDLCPNFNKIRVNVAVWKPMEIHDCLQAALGFVLRSIHSLCRSPEVYECWQEEAFQNILVLSLTLLITHYLCVFK